MSVRVSLLSLSCQPTDWLLEWRSQTYHRLDSLARPSACRCASFLLHPFSFWPVSLVVKANVMLLRLHCCTDFKANDKADETPDYWAFNIYGTSGGGRLGLVAPTAHPV